MSNFAEQYKASTEEFMALAKSLTESQLDISDHEGWTPRQVFITWLIVKHSHMPDYAAW